MVVDKLPIQKEYKNALDGDMNLNEKIMKLGELNKLASEVLILSIHTNSWMINVEFGFVRNAKSLEFPEGNCKFASDRLENKYAPHMALSLLK